MAHAEAKRSFDQQDGIAKDLAGKLTKSVPRKASILKSASLTDASNKGTLMHMRTTLNIDDKLLSEASRLTGVAEKTSLVRMGLEALVRREAARRLAAMGGADHRATGAPRKRSRDRKG